MSPKDAVFVIGNPLLDIQVTVDQAYLEKYGLKENDAILADEKHFPIYDEIQKMDSVKYLAGGSAQNTARGISLLLGPGTVTYSGAVGTDANAARLEKENSSYGVTTAYQSVGNLPTGTCGVLITGKHRSMVTNLAAANAYSPEKLKDEKVWGAVEKSQYILLSGYFLTVSEAAALALAEHATANNKTLILSLSAPFIPIVFKDTLAKLLPHIDVLFGNETELEAFAKSFGLPTSVHQELAKQAQALPKAKSGTPRRVVITHSENPVIVADADGVKTFPVPELNQSSIVDSNGAGDGFLAGLIAGMVLGKPVEKQVEIGCFLGQQVLLESGPHYNEKCIAFAKTV